MEDKWTRAVLELDTFFVEISVDPMIKDSFIVERLVNLLSYHGFLSYRISKNIFYTNATLDEISSTCATTYTEGPVLGLFNIIDSNNNSYDFMYSESQGIVF